MALALLCGFATATPGLQNAALEDRKLEPIPASEFARLVLDLSEDDGYFRSDNFVSNETSYLHILDKAAELGETGGTYLGVGPEQNFTYIAQLKPKLAFILDIRRQAVLQHLMYKAIFHLADNRVEFLSRLFSVPPPEDATLLQLGGIEKILDYFSTTPDSAEFFFRNVSEIRRSIGEDFHIPLSVHDRATLDYLSAAFRSAKLAIRYGSNPSGWSGPQWGRFPSLRDIILEQDLKGKTRNFLAAEDDYRFVRDMQRGNRIIPIVGDFAGPKALSGIGAYLKKRNDTVNFFYTSNVEQYLFTNGVFAKFAGNLRQLPINDKSLFIRAFPNMREAHPAMVPGHRLTTLLERISVFIKDFDDGLYPDYWSLVTTNFIAPDVP